MTATIALDVVVATAISWTVLSADFNRHAITQRAGIIGTTLGYTASTVISMTLGATALGYVFLRGKETTSFDPTVILEEFGLPLAVVIFVSVMATNTLVVYGMTMSFENLRPNSNYVRAALVIGLISIAGATWQGILDRFVSFLFLISALFVPVFAIMIVDYWILRRGRYSTSDLVVPRGGAYWYLARSEPNRRRILRRWRDSGVLLDSGESAVLRCHSSDVRAHLRALPRPEPCLGLESEPT